MTLLASALFRLVSDVPRSALFRLVADVSSARAAAEALDAVVESPVLSRAVAEMAKLGAELDAFGADAADLLLTLRAGTLAAEDLRAVEHELTLLSKRAQSFADADLASVREGLDEVNESLRSRAIGRIVGGVAAAEKAASRLADALVDLSEKASDAASAAEEAEEAA